MLSKVKSALDGISSKNSIALEVCRLLDRDGYTNYLDYPISITTDTHISSGEDYLTGSEVVSLFFLPIGSLLIEII